MGESSFRFPLLIVKMDRMTKAFVLPFLLCLLQFGGCAPGREETLPPAPAKLVAPFHRPLSPSEGESLLVLARKTLEAVLLRKEPPRYRIHSAALNREGGGAFVTLETAEGKLRGCIGRFESPYPLHATVRAMAMAAAAHDRRFPPVTRAELDGLRIRVSLLSPMTRVSNPPAGIELGRHGILVRCGDRRGCYLPEVAAQMGWSVEEFLERCTVEKALLEGGAWRRKDAEVLVFTTQVFQEKLGNGAARSAP